MANGWNGIDGTVRGLFYGDAHQFVAQVIGALTCFVLVFGLSYIFFKVEDKIHGIRVSREDELAGLDVLHMGVPAYED